MEYGRCVCGLQKCVGGGPWDFVMKKLTQNTQEYNLALEEVYWDWWPTSPITLSPPISPHMDNYINFQPSHTLTHTRSYGWLTQTSCALGERWKKAREGHVNWRGQERDFMEEIKRRKTGRKDNSVSVWMIYGDQRQPWCNTLHLCFPLWRISSASQTLFWRFSE